MYSIVLLTYYYLNILNTYLYHSFDLNLKVSSLNSKIKNKYFLLNSLFGFYSNLISYCLL
jgi:hypothetical protein